MNKDNARDYLPLVQALAEGKTIQLMHNGEWFNLPNALFNWPANHYRVKPELKKAWYRVGISKGLNGVLSAFCVVDEDGVKHWNEMHNFVGWLTDRIEYELPEGDA